MKAECLQEGEACRVTVGPQPPGCVTSLSVLLAEQVVLKTGRTEPVCVGSRLGSGCELTRTSLASSG